MPQLPHAAVQKPGKTSLQQHPQGTAPCREATRGTGRALPREGCFLGEILFPSPLAPVIPGSNRIPLSPHESSCRAWGSLLEQPWSVKLHFLKCFQGAFPITALFSYLGKYLFSQFYLAAQFYLILPFPETMMEIMKFENNS